MERVAIFLTVVVLASGATSAEDKFGPHYEHLKCYQQLIGTWKYEGPILEDIEGICRTGDPIVLRQSFSWVLNKNAIEFRAEGKVKGEPGFEISARNLIGWDPVNQRIIERGMNSIGGHAQRTIAYDEASKTWTGQWKGANQDGEKTSSRDVLKLKDKSTYVAQSFNRRGLIVKGSGPKYTFERVDKKRNKRGAADVAESEASRTPRSGTNKQRCREWFDYLEGKWEAENGAEFEFRYTAGGVALIGEAALPRGENAVMMWAWDAGNNGPIFSWFDSKGTYARQEYSIVTKDYQAGLVYRSAADGESTGNVVVQRLGPDRYKVTVKTANPDGTVTEASSEIMRQK